MKNAVNSLYIKIKKVIPFNIIKKSLSYFFFNILYFYNGIDLFFTFSIIYINS